MFVMNMLISFDEFKKNFDKYLEMVKEGETVNFTDNKGNVCAMTPIKKNKPSRQ